MNQDEKRGNGCPYFKKCDGCQIRNLPYQKQLSFKQVSCIKTLGRFCHVDEIIGMERPEHYRNKVSAAFSQRGGKILSGIYSASTHRVLDIKSCQNEDQTADKIIQTIKELLPKFKIAPFNEKSKSGILRHVLVRVGKTSGQIMVILVVFSFDIKNLKPFLNELLRREEEITTVVLNQNNKYTSMVLGEKNKTVFGDGFIFDSLLGKTFRLSPRSFFQINPTQTEKLYQTAMDFAKIKPSETVFDAYSGIGTIGIIASSRAKKVFCVESNPDAVNDARVNARLNDVNNIDFVCADAGEFLVKMAREKQELDVLFLDPPRAGASTEFLRSVMKLFPKRIVYISCNIKTQERDISLLLKRGYKVKKIQPVDMFPHTSHIECVALLEGSKKEKKV